MKSDALIAKAVELAEQAKRKRNEDTDRISSVLGTLPMRAPGKKKQPIFQLPLWPDVMRALPNEILRSALFNARNRKKPRVFLKDEPITVIGEGLITYRGEELRQDDEMVWLQLLHLARGSVAGQPVEFTAYSFCKNIGWSINKQSYKRLYECLKRMQATGLEVYVPRIKRGISLSMIPSFEYEDVETREALPRWRVRLAPELVELFGDSHYTRIHWEERLKLPDGLASWMHGYFASHRDPYPIKIETVASGAGLTESDKPELRRMVKRALGNLVEVGFLEEFSVAKDLITVKRVK
nr:TrfA family protein [uncultured bacterium]